MLRDIELELGQVLQIDLTLRAGRADHDSSGVQAESPLIDVKQSAAGATMTTSSSIGSRRSATTRRS